MADDIKPSDRVLAERIIAAAGVDVAALPDSAKAQFERAQEAAAKEPIDPDAPVLSEREQWTRNAGKQLRRFFGGRCLTCVHWTPADAGPGACPYIAIAPKAGVVILTPGFGCTLWGEIPADDLVTIDTRTNLAMALEFVHPYPEPE